VEDTEGYCSFWKSGDTDFQKNSSAFRARNLSNRKAVELFFIAGISRQ
jgi:hypothetical protein